MKKMKPTDVISHEIACEVLKRDPNALPDYSMLPEHQQIMQLADKKLLDIAEAINLLDNNFVADFSNGRQEKWRPFFNANEGFAFSRSNCDLWGTFTLVGSRLCFRFRSEKTSDYFGTQFNDLHKQSFYGKK